MSNNRPSNQNNKECAIIFLVQVKMLTQHRSLLCKMMYTPANKRAQTKVFLQRSMKPTASICQTGPLLRIMASFTELKTIKLLHHDTSMKLQNSNPFMSSQTFLMKQSSFRTLNDFLI